MAYRRNTTRRAASRSGGYRSRPRAAAARRRGSRSRSARTGQRQQTLKIVVETVPASPISRPEGVPQMETPTKRGKF